MAITNIDMPKWPCSVVYDTAATVPIIGADADHSVIMPAPVLVQIDTIPAATTLSLQAKVHKDAAWAELATYTSANTPAFISMSDVATCYPVVPNHVQLVRTVGSGDVKAYAQF